MQRLKITKCPDPLMWYAGMVGQCVPYLGQWPGEGYKSREPASYVNIVKFEDAEIIKEKQTMKTTGLTLQEAASLLLDGKCTGIKHGNDIVYTKGAGNQLLHPVIDLRTFHLGPIWSLVNPVQEYEEVEVVQWSICGGDVNILGLTSKSSAEEFAIQYPGSRIVRLTGIDRVPKREKVVHRVEVECGVSSDGDVWGNINNCPFKAHPETHGKTGKLIFEWDE